MLNKLTIKVWSAFSNSNTESFLTALRLRYLFLISRKLCDKSNDKKILHKHSDHWKHPSLDYFFFKKRNNVRFWWLLDFFTCLRQIVFANNHYFDIVIRSIGSLQCCLSLLLNIMCKCIQMAARNIDEKSYLVHC